MTYLNIFDTKKFETTIFKSTDDFTDKTSLNTIMFDQNKTLFSCVSHDKFSNDIELSDLNMQSIKDKWHTRRRKEKKYGK